MYLSKSKYCSAHQCLKMLWLSEFKPEVKEDTNNEGVLENGTEVGIIAKKLLGKPIDIEFNEDLQVMIKDTEESLKQDSVIITEASFSYNNNFCSVDILKKDKDSYEIYEVKSSTSISDIYLEDVSYQVYVLKSLGYNITKASIVYINSKYIRGKKLDLRKLFIIEDVTDIALQKQEKIEKNIEEINEYIKEKSEPKQDIGMHCVKPYDCPFFKYCTNNLVRPNVFDIRGMSISNKFKLYNKNKIIIKELLQDKLNNKYLEQIDFELNDKEPSIKKDEIKEFLNTLTFPMYFLDFETFQESIPVLENSSPYEQIPFQYSLHYLENENSTLKHTEFLAKINTDPRRDLAENLIKNIPRNTCVIAYNSSFEKMIIKRLASLYPDLSEHLMNIYHNIKDLMIPFKNRSYYTKEMQGSYSIKYVLPALFPNDKNLDYHALNNIHNGSEAMNSFKNLKNVTKEEQERIRKDLLKYCELDTLAMVKIYEKLVEETILQAN